MIGKLFLARENRSELGQAVNLGLDCAVGMAVFSFLGFWIDQRRGGDRILFTLLGMTLGLAYGAYEVWKVIRMLNRQCAEACRQNASAAGDPVLESKFGLPEEPRAGDNPRDHVIVNDQQESMHDNQTGSEDRP